MFESLINVNYLIAQEIRFGESSCNDLCYIKYLALLFGDIVLWKMSFIHDCERCLIPERAFLYDANELKEILFGISHKVNYRLYVANTIKEKSITDKMLSTFLEVGNL